MPEQESPSLGNRLPRISDEDFEKLMSSVKHGKLTQEYYEDLAIKEPILHNFIFEFSHNLPHPEKFYRGALSCMVILDGLNQQGFNFPIVSLETIRAFEAVFKRRGLQLIPKFATIRTEQELDELVRTVDPASSRVFPTANLFEKENPILISSFFVYDVFSKHGAMVVYSLKRQQFYRDKLSAPLGVN